MSVYVSVKICTGNIFVKTLTIYHVYWHLTLTLLIFPLMLSGALNLDRLSKSWRWGWGIRQISTLRQNLREMTIIKLILHICSLKTNFLSEWGPWVLKAFTKVSNRFILCKRSVMETKHKVQVSEWQLHDLNFILNLWPQIISDYYAPHLLFAEDQPDTH